MIDHVCFIVGAQRSATTYLYHLLAAHPEIEMARPTKPEPKFFITDALFERGLDYYQSTYFEGKPDAWLRGEKSTSYMETEKAAQRIAANYPQAKILFLLRDPVERAISNYWFSHNNGLETLSIEEAFRREDQRWKDYDPAKVSVSPFAYLRRGCYIENLQMYECYFPLEQLKVIIHEQLIGSPEVVADLYAYLGVQANFMPSGLDQKVNSAEKDTLEISPRLRHELNEYFAEPNLKLAQHLGVSLDEWPSVKDGVR